MFEQKTVSSRSLRVQVAVLPPLQRLPPTRNKNHLLPHRGEIKSVQGSTSCFIESCLCTVSRSLNHPHKRESSYSDRLSSAGRLKVTTAVTAVTLSWLVLLLLLAPHRLMMMMMMTNRLDLRFHQASAAPQLMTTMTMMTPCRRMRMM